MQEVPFIDDMAMGYPYQEAELSRSQVGISFIITFLAYQDFILTGQLLMLEGTSPPGENH